MGTEIWNWLDTGASDAALNMAIDEALLERTDERGIPLLRVYEWTRPSISIGYFMPYPEQYASSHAIVRRPTGGGLVFHGKDLTFTFLVPRNHELYRVRACDSYQSLHSMIVQALQRIGIPCALHAGCATAAQGACFELPVAHDILLDGKKIVGGAQRRTKHGLLHQGSLLLPPSRRKSLEELRAAFRNGFPASWTEIPLTQKDRERADSIASTRFGTEGWNRKFAEAQGRTGSGVSVKRR